MSVLLILGLVFLVNASGSYCGVGEYRFFRESEPSSSFEDIDVNIFSAVDQTVDGFGCLHEPSFPPSEIHNGLCVKCPAGTYKMVAGDDKSLCIPCSSGMWPIDDGSKCACQPGMYFSAGECKVCGSGTFKASVSNASACQSCPDNAVVVAGEQCRESCSCTSGFIFNQLGLCASAFHSRFMSASGGASPSPSPAESPVQIVSKFPVTGTFSSQDFTSAYSAVQSAIASAFGVSQSSVTVLSISYGSSGRRLAAGAVLTVTYTIQPSGAVSMGDISTKVGGNSTFSAGVLGQITTAVNSATSSSTSLAAPTSVVVSVSPAPAPTPAGKGGLQSGIIALIAIVVIAAIAGAGFFVYKRLQDSPHHELERHQSSL